METIEYKNISFTIWDLGSQDKIQPVLPLLPDTQGLIFIVDKIDRDLNKVCEKLIRMLAEDEFWFSWCWPVSNFSSAMNVAKITGKLGLHSVCHKKCYIRPPVATSRDWLVPVIWNQKWTRPPSSPTPAFFFSTLCFPFMWQTCYSMFWVPEAVSMGWSQCAWHHAVNTQMQPAARFLFSVNSFCFHWDSFWYSYAVLFSFFVKREPTHCQYLKGI